MERKQPVPDDHYSEQVMTYPPDSLTRIHVIWQCISPGGYPNLVDLQDRRIGLSATLLAPNTVDSKDQVAPKQVRPHLVIAFVGPDNTETTTQAHQLVPDAATIAVSTPRNMQDTFAAVQDIAEVLNGSTLIGIDLEDVMFVLGLERGASNKGEILVADATSGNLETALSACLHSLHSQPSTVEGLLLLIAAPKGSLMLHELRQTNKQIQAYFANLRRFIYAVCETPKLTSSKRMSLWTSPIQWKN